MKSSAISILNELFERYQQLTPIKGAIEAAINDILVCYRAGGKLLVCGNGGSASDSEHIVGELMKGFRLSRPISGRVEQALAKQSANLVNRLQSPLCAICLNSQTSLLTAISNDIGSDMVFAQQVFGYGKPGDILLAMSTSGNAENVVNAAQVAHAAEMRVIAMTGARGGKLAAHCDVLINVPEAETHKVQELHLPVYHCICAAVEEEMFGEAVS